MDDKIQLPANFAELMVEDQIPYLSKEAKVMYLNRLEKKKKVSIAVVFDLILINFGGHFWYTNQPGWGLIFLIIGLFNIGMISMAGVGVLFMLGATIFALIGASSSVSLANENIKKDALKDALMVDGYSILDYARPHASQPKQQSVSDRQNDKTNKIILISIAVILISIISMASCAS